MSDYQVTVSVSADASALSNIESQINNLSRSVSLNLDTSGAESKLKSIQSQMNNLGKGISGGSSSGFSSATTAAEKYVSSVARQLNNLSSSSTQTANRVVRNASKITDEVYGKTLSQFNTQLSQLSTNYDGYSKISDSINDVKNAYSALDKQRTDSSMRIESRNQALLQQQERLQKGYIDQAKYDQIASRYHKDSLKDIENTRRATEAYNKAVETTKGYVKDATSGGWQLADKNSVRAAQDQLALWKQANSRINGTSYGKQLDAYQEKLQDSNIAAGELKQTMADIQHTQNQAQLNGQTGLSMFDKMKGYASNMAYNLVAFQSIQKAAQAVGKSVGNLKDIDSLLNEISQVSGITGDRLEAMGDAALENASNYGRSATDYLTAMKEMTRAGFYGQDAENMTNLSMLAQAAGGIDADTANKYILASNAAYQYGGNVEKLTSLLDGQATIANKNAVSLQDMASATQIVASVSTMYGVAEDQLSSLIGTAQNATQQGGQVVGTALRNLFLNLENTKASTYVDALESIGVAQTEFVDGVEKSRSAVDILTDVHEAFESLAEDDPLRNALVQQLGGKRSANILSAILSDWDVYEKMLNQYAEGQGTAQEMADKAATSWEGSLQRLQNDFTGLTKNFINSDTAKFGINVADTFVNIAKSATDATDGMGGLAQSMTMFGTLDVITSLPKILSAFSEVGSLADIPSALSLAFESTKIGGAATKLLGGLGGALGLTTTATAGLAAGTIALGAAFNYAYKSDERHEKGVTRTYQAYDDAKNSALTLEEQLGAVNDQIDALEDKGNLTNSEKSTLASLKRDANELSAQLDKTQDDVKKTAIASADALREGTTEDISEAYSAMRRYASENGVESLNDNANFKNILADNIAKYQVAKEELRKAKRDQDEVSQENAQNVLDQARSDLAPQIADLKLYRNEAKELAKQTGRQKDQNAFNDLDSYWRQLDYDGWFGQRMDEVIEESGENVRSSLEAMAEKGTLSVDSLKNKFPELYTALNDAGLGVGKVVEGVISDYEQLSSGGAQAIEQLEDSYEDFKTSAVAMINGMDVVNAAMVDSVSGNGLKIKSDQNGNLTGSLVDLQNYFKSIDFSSMGIDYDPSTLFEATANGVHLNTKALRAYQSAAESIEKKKYADKISNLSSKLQDAEKAQKDYDDVVKNYGEDVAKASDKVSDHTAIISSLKDQLQEAKFLQAAYNGSVSAYQKWQDALKSGEEGDRYNAIRDTAMSRGDELLNEGLVGTNEFRSIAQMFSYDDLSTAPIDQIVQAYQNGVSAVRGFFTEGKQGVLDFADYVKQACDEAGGAIGEVTGDGSDDNPFMFKNVDTDALAERLGVSADIVESIFGRMSDYGVDVSFLNEEQTANIEKATEQANNARDALAQMQESAKGAGEAMGDIDMSATQFDLDELNTVDEIQGKMDELNNLKATPGISPEGLEQIDSEIDACKQKLDTLNEANANPTVTIEGVESALSMAQNLQSSIQEVHNMEAKGVNISVEGSAEIQQMADQISALPSDVQMAIGFEPTDDPDSIIQQVESGTAEIPVTFKPEGDATEGTDGESVDVTVNYKPGDMPEPPEKTVDITVNYQPGDMPDPPESSVDIDVNYNAGHMPDPPKSSVDIDVNYNAGSIPEPSPSSVDVDVNYNAGSVPAPSPSTVNVGVNYVANNTLEAPNINPTVDYTLNAPPEPNYPNISRTVTYSLNAPPPPSYPNMSRTVTYTIQTIGSPPHVAHGTTGARAYANGTTGAHTSGNAFVSGDWSVGRSERALVGELGRETIVRGGKFFTVGDQGAEFVNLQAGDIVFNHEQTRALLEGGKISSRGKILGGGRAHVTGTALAKATTSGLTRSTPGIGGGGGGSSSGKKSGGGSSSGGGGSSSGGGGGSSSGSSSGSSKDDAEEQVLDWVERLVDRIEASADHFDEMVDQSFNSFTTQVAAGWESILEQRRLYDANNSAAQTYLDKANSLGLDQSYIDKIQKGEFLLESTTDKDLKDKIDKYIDYYDKYLDSLEDAEKAQEAWRKGFVTYFEIRADYYESEIKLIEERNDAIESYIDLLEEEGKVATEAAYQASISMQRQNIIRLQQERAQLEDSLNLALLNHAIDRESKEYNSMLHTIKEVSSAIVEAQTEIAKLNNEIQELKWDTFDSLADSIEDFADETSFVEELLGDKIYDEESGSITKNGQAILALRAMRYDAYMKQAQGYAQQIADIDKLLETDPYNSNYLEQRQKYVKSQQDAIKNAIDEKEAVIDLVNDGYDEELDALDKIIEKKLDLLDINKDEYKYAKDIAKKQEEINRLQKQLMVYGEDDSEEGSATRQSLLDDLADAQSDLEDKMYDKRIDDTEKLLDDLYDAYEELFNSRMDDVDGSMQLILETLKEYDVADIAETIRGVTTEVGYTLSDQMEIALSTDGDLISEFNKDFTNQSAGVLVALNSIETLIREIYEYNEAETKKRVDQEHEDEIGRLKKNSIATSEGNFRKYGDYANIYDYEYYRSKYPDLVAAYGDNEDAYFQHFLKWGMPAGRQASAYFDVNYYRQQHPELEALYGDQMQGYYEHFRRWGKDAGYSGTPIYDYNAYREMNPDLVKAYGNNAGKYFEHFVKWGMSEGRQASDLFDVKYYKAMYEDLVDHYGEDLRKYYEHYMKWGIGEGRKGAPTSGYARGSASLPSSGNFWTNERGAETIIRKSDGAILDHLSAGDMVLNNDARKVLWSLVQNPNQFISSFINDMPDVRQMTGGGNTSTNVDSTITFNLPNVSNYDEFKRELQRDPKFEQLVQDMTIGRINGNSRMKKYNISM